MTEQSRSKEGIGVEYDHENHVLSITPILPDGRSLQTIEMKREKAIQLYRSLGETLAPALDG